MGALLRPGDRVLGEFPGYDPIVGAARFLGADVRFIERNWDNGCTVYVDGLAQEVTPSTRLIVLADLHNLTGVYADPWTLMTSAE